LIVNKQRAFENMFHDARSVLIDSIQDSHLSVDVHILLVFILNLIKPIIQFAFNFEIRNSFLDSLIIQNG